ncbi:MAG: hypothetical protein K2X86_18760 [Cytophagaceae bacterium]|nr:hypothetical protein [Cytophagaceae bacterium]
MKVVTLTDKEEKLLIKLVDKAMKNKHEKFEANQKDMNDQEIVKHNKKMVVLSLLKEKLK